MGWVCFCTHPLWSMEAPLFLTSSSPPPPPPPPLTCPLPTMTKPSKKTTPGAGDGRAAARGGGAGGAEALLGALGRAGDRINELYWVLVVVCAPGKDREASRKPPHSSCSAPFYINTRTHAQHNTQAIANHLRDWVHGTAAGEFVSMGVYTAADNPYGVPADIFFSFPVTCQVHIFFENEKKLEGIEGCDAGGFVSVVVASAAQHRHPKNKAPSKPHPTRHTPHTPHTQHNPTPPERHQPTNHPPSPHPPPPNNRTASGASSPA